MNKKLELTDKKLVVRFPLELLELIKEAMAATRIFNRTQFLREVIKVQCERILKF